MRAVAWGQNAMSREQQELDSHRQEIVVDMCSLVEKYRKIFDWDIKHIDQHAADKLILSAMHTALDEIAGQLPH
jgi:hypothetical protein